MTKTYDDIIHLPRHVSTKHPQMALIDRAAQFSPFAALTGHGAAINETARLTDERAELDEYMKDILRDKLQIIVERLKDKPEVTFTYFQPDEMKNGGAYVTVVGMVKKIDEYERIVVMTDAQEIPMDEIVDIKGQIFGGLEDIL